MQPKAIAHPTDNRLLNRAGEQLVEEAAAAHSTACSLSPSAVPLLPVVTATAPVVEGCGIRVRRPGAA